MFSNAAELAGTIDHTRLAPDTTLRDVLRACEEAQRYGFAAVCTPPRYVKEASAWLRGSRVAVATVIGFPFGYQSSSIKQIEACEAVQCGATEVDVVIHLGSVKVGDADAVRNELKQIREAVRGILLRVILETGYLSRREMISACRWTREARLNWVKTSTGFGPKGASVRDVRILKKTMGKRGFVKAAGGIRDFQSAAAMIRAGAARIGTSRGVEIMKEYMRGQGGS
jgi:deoxyribose-phosphate aldolase